MPRVVRVRPEGYLREREYQDSALEALALLYPAVEVKTQWYPFAGEGLDIYAPVVDIAVGPFAIRGRYGEQYTQLMNETRPFIQRLIDCHNENIDARQEATTFERLEWFNENARCLFCIEIEESGSRKHCLGNLVNASALGRIGLLVARTEVVKRTFVRQRSYLQFLADVDKNTFRTGNALILTAAQFDECLARGMGG
jgi:hypothetical protein